MDMSVGGEGSILERILSSKDFTAISHYFVMDWVSVWIDIALGLVIAGALAAWVPKEFWQAFFLSADPVWSKIVGPLIGPIVAIVSFVCSVGNVPHAAVLWNGGISFGGVIAFLFVDLIVLPILDIYRRYYGTEIALVPLGVSYAAMVGAAYIIELIFGIAGLVPQQRSAEIVETQITWNYATWLNIVFIGLAAVLVWRFMRTGGPTMLRMMNQTTPAEAHHHSLEPQQPPSRFPSSRQCPTMSGSHAALRINFADSRAILNIFDTKASVTLPGKIQPFILEHLFSTPINRSLMPSRFLR